MRKGDCLLTSEEFEQYREGLNRQWQECEVERERRQVAQDNENRLRRDIAREWAERNYRRKIETGE